MIYVLNFWFTSCMPCVAEMPKLNKLREKYKGSNIRFVAVTFENNNQVDKFLKKNPFDYEIFVSGQDITKQFKIVAYPTNIIINRRGHIIFKEEGLSGNTFEKLETLLKITLNEK